MPRRTSALRHGRQIAERSQDGHDRPPAGLPRFFPTSPAAAIGLHRAAPRRSSPLPAESPSSILPSSCFHRRPGKRLPLLESCEFYSWEKNGLQALFLITLMRDGEGTARPTLRILRAFEGCACRWHPVRSLLLPL